MSIFVDQRPFAMKNIIFRTFTGRTSDFMENSAKIYKRARYNLMWIHSPDRVDEIDFNIHIMFQTFTEMYHPDCYDFMCFLILANSLRMTAMRKFITSGGDTKVLKNLLDY